jgi:hypothetical protein
VKCHDYYENDKGQTVHAYWPDVRGSTDEKGRAPLDRLDPETVYALNVEPPSGRRDLEEVWIQNWSPADTTVQIGTGLTVSGTVVDARGRPLRGINVEAVGNVTHSTSTNRDGAFVLGPFRRGSVTVKATTEERWGWSPVLEDRTSDTVDVMAGTRGLEIRLPTGVPITVRVEDWDTYPTSRANYGYLFEEVAPGADEKEGEKKEPASAEAYVYEDGTAEFEHADPDKTYTFWLGPLEDGRHAYRTGIRPGGREVRVRLEEGRSIRGRLHVPPGCIRERVYATRGRVYVYGTLTPDGRFEIRGLPRGSWDVTGSARVRVDGKWRTVKASVRAHAGGSADVTLPSR